MAAEELYVFNVNKNNGNLKQRFFGIWVQSANQVETATKKSNED